MNYMKAKNLCNYLEINNIKRPASLEELWEVGFYQYLNIR